MATNLQSYNQQCQSNMYQNHKIPGKITENQYKIKYKPGNINVPKR